MALSDDEEKILAQIEAGIRSSDPDLVQHVEQSNVYRYSGRKIVISVTGIIFLLVVVILTFSNNLWPIAFVSFILMVIVGISLAEHVLKLGRVSVDEARKQAQKMSSTPSWKYRNK